MEKPHWDALLQGFLEAHPSPATNKKWVSWPKDSGVDLVDLYMCRIKGIITRGATTPRDSETADTSESQECLMQLFDSLSTAAMRDVLITKLRCVVSLLQWQGALC